MTNYSSSDITLGFYSSDINFPIIVFQFENRPEIFGFLYFEYYNRWDLRLKLLS